MTLASIVLAGAVTIGGFWGEQYEKLTAKWLPHCIHEMEKGEWTLPLPEQTVTAIPEVKACAGLVANQRGPLRALSRKLFEIGCALDRERRNLGPWLVEKYNWEL